MDWGNQTRTQLKKPRSHGVTMVMDKGLGIHAFEDLLSLAAVYIDFIKLGFGTLALTPPEIVQQKIELAKKYDIHLYPGGTFFEVTYQSQKVSTYFHWLATLGFTWVEISTGVLTLEDSVRLQLIEQAQNAGFQIITEIGKKQAGSITPIKQLITQFEQDLHAGANYVIIEGRETGENIGIFNQQGEVDTTYVKQVNESIQLDKCIWEAPKKGQQVTLMKLLGPNVNLGNIAPSDILSVESLRQGLRADTFALKQENQ